MLTKIVENVHFLWGNLRLQDLVDLLLVWLVVYRLLVLIRRTGTVQMLSGLGILGISYVLSIWLELYTFNWLLEKFFNNLFVIIVVLFQAEIRRALAQIGINPYLTGIEVVRETHMIEELAKALIQMAQKGIGALVVIEREISVDYYIEDGVKLDAKITAELITSIFQTSSILHDGAVLIREGRVHSASCFLPLSKNPVLDRNLGSRHRAAIGLSEETDAVVFVVSEETKSVGIVQGGHLQPDVDLVTIRRTLYDIYDLKYRGPQGQGEQQ